MAQNGVKSDEKSVVLPIPGKRNILITSALPYVNNVPHLGNIIGSLLSADVFARYCRARGLNTIFICGTDEFGTATETKAIEEGITPQQLCDKYHAIHTQVYEWFNLKFDYWGRTPTEQQKEIVQHIFLKDKENGYMTERTTEQPFCEKHQGFLADRFVEGTCPQCNFPDARGDQCDNCGKTLDDPLDLVNPRCKLEGATPIRKNTSHWFLQLDKLQPALEEWFSEASKKGRWSANGISITQNWLNEGLKPRSITRDYKWGVPVPMPGYENKVFYVWFDACIGYISITANYTKDWEKWWRDPENVQLYQFMGKDNVPFHSVTFPCSLIGTGEPWTKLHHLSTAEYMNYERTKFSKSRGVGVFGTNAKDTGVPSDVWRYYLLKNRPETSDSEFEWSSFISANNSELLNNLGNFVNRTIKFTNSDKFYNSVVPDYTKYLSSSTEAADDSFNFKEWQDGINELLEEYISELEVAKLRSGISIAMRVAAEGNRLLQSNTLDGKLFTGQPDKCAAVVGLGINLIHLIAGLICPYMPDTADSILSQLNVEGPPTIPDVWETNAIKPGHILGTAKHLFQLIKPSQEEVWKDQFGGKEAQKAKEEAAAKRAAKKLESQKKKEKAKASANAAKKGSSAEAGAKIDATKFDIDNEGVEEVTKGVHQAALHSS